MRFLGLFTEHPLSLRVLDAFRVGTPGTGLYPITWGLSGTGAIPVYYGILRGGKERIHVDMRFGRPWVYIDHGYFGDHDNENLTGHYRIVVGGLHHRIPEWPKSSVPRDIGGIVVLSPFRNADELRANAGNPLVIVPPSPHVADFYGIDVDDWVRQHGSVPPVVVSTKASGTLYEAMKNCRGVVSHSSTASVAALAAGIPASCTAERAPLPNHGSYDRRDLFGWLAERQFTLQEIRNGEHLGHLNGEIEAWEKSSRAAKTA